MFLVGCAPTANRTLPDIATGTHLENDGDSEGELCRMACKRVSVGTDVLYALKRTFLKLC